MVGDVPFLLAVALLAIAGAATFAWTIRILGLHGLQLREGVERADGSTKRGP